MEEEMATAKLNQSIHPRVFWGGTKLNTCAAKRPETLARAIAGTKEHLVRHPRDGFAQARVVSFEARLNRKGAA